MKTKKYHAHTRYRLAPTRSYPKGELVPGVTTIVSVLNKPALVNWANRLGLEGIQVGKYVDDKADIGTLAHAMIIAEITGEEISVDLDEYSLAQRDAAENACLSFFEWQKKHKLEVVAAEKSLVSERRGFGGTFDIYGICDGKRELIDLKTGSGIYEEHWIQCGGYTILLEEHGWPVDSIRILNIPRAESENFAEQTASKSVRQYAEALFLECLEVYTLQKTLRKLLKKS